MDLLERVELFKVAQLVSERDRIRTQSTSQVTLVTIIKSLPEDIMASSGICWHWEISGYKEQSLERDWGLTPSFTVISSGKVNYIVLNCTFFSFSFLTFLCKENNNKAFVRKKWYTSHGNMWQSMWHSKCSVYSLSLPFSCQQGTQILCSWEDTEDRRNEETQQGR